MTVLTCAAVQRRLPAYYDRELPVAELIAVDGHLNGCPPCTRDLRELQSVGDALRIAAAPAPADDWTGLQPGVISRMKAEAHESWSARTHRLFDDMHLVWIGLAATVATFVCGAIVLSMLRFASPERHDSLAAILAVMAAPSGSDLNPLRLDRYISATTGETFYFGHNINVAIIECDVGAHAFGHRESMFVSIDADDQRGSHQLCASRCTQTDWPLCKHNNRVADLYPCRLGAAKAG